MEEYRARVISQEKGLYRIRYEGREFNWNAENTGYAESPGSM